MKILVENDRDTRNLPRFQRAHNGENQQAYAENNVADPQILGQEDLGNFLFR